MITAQITEFSVPSQLRVGDNLDISFRYTASNSEWSVFNSKWRTFAVASVPGIGDFLLDDSVRSWENTDSGTKTRTLGKVPQTSSLTVSIYLFASSDAAYEWTWQAYQEWLAWGILDSAYKRITVIEQLPPVAEYESVEFHITPAGSGQIQVSPPDKNGKTLFNNEDLGIYPHGSVLTYTARAGYGYQFEKWSDRIGTNIFYENPFTANPLTFSGYTKAHFDVISQVEYESVEFHITPVGSGQIQVSPPDNNGETVFGNNDRGVYPHGSILTYTARPEDGYQFEKWSDRFWTYLYVNPFIANPLTSSGYAKAHFNEIGSAPPVPVPPVPVPPVPVPPVPPEEPGKFPLGPVLIGAGVLALLAALIPSGKEKP